MRWQNSEVSGAQLCSPTFGARQSMGLGRKAAQVARAKPVRKKAAIRK